MSKELQNLYVKDQALKKIGKLGRKFVEKKATEKELNRREMLEAEQEKITEEQENI